MPDRDGAIICEVDPDFLEYTHRQDADEGRFLRALPGTGLLREP